ncbi:hypothetical protein GCM10008949_51000 [Deinococcus humi]|nr:hypothetical protein GCM10008949_51000 [Deinococcus humi]
MIPEREPGPRKGARPTGEDRKDSCKTAGQGSPAPWGMLTFRPAVPGLLLSSVLWGAAGAQDAVPALAAEFKLAAGSYTAVQTLPSLGLRAPPGSLHLNELRPVRGIHAADLRAYQEAVPKSYQTRCVGVLDLTLVPANVNEAPALVERWARETDALVLSRTFGRATFLRGPASKPVLSMVRPVAGAVLIATCPVAEVPQPVGAWLALGQRSAAGTLLAFNWYGTLAVCVDGQEQPRWNVRAFEGAVQLATRNPEASRVAAVGWDRGGLAVKVFAPPAKVPLSRAPLTGTPRSVFLSEDGQRVTVLTQDNSSRPRSVVTSVNAQTGRAVARQVLDPGERAETVSSDGLWMVTTATSTLRLVEILSGKVLWSSKASVATTFEFARGNRWLVGMDQKGQAITWQTDGGRRGPSVQVDGRTRTVLLPGPAMDQLSILSGNATSSSAPGEWSTLTWTVGTGVPVSQGQVSGTGEEGVVLEVQTGRPRLIRMCEVAAGLPPVFP